MYCKCNQSYNYQVVGLCDKVSKYDTKTTEPWTQITVPEILTIPDCYPDIEDIERIYINVKIDSTRVVKTPVKKDKGVPVKNEEGTLLSGRKLLVDGMICQTVVYTADTCQQSLHSINFKYPFCTYIIIPDDGVDIELSKYCVDACIEDVFAKVLNKRVIFKNVTLFLKAKKPETECCKESEKTAQVTAKVNYTGTKNKTLDVAIKLYKDGVFIDRTIQTVTSGKALNYNFTKLCPGTYTVVFEIDKKYNVKQTVSGSPVTVTAGGSGTVTDTVEDITP